MLFDLIHMDESYDSVLYPSRFQNLTVQLVKPSWMIVEVDFIVLCEPSVEVIHNSLKLLICNRIGVFFVPLMLYARKPNAISI